jgi:two-component system, NarL family, nitrate/nitrite response regulator NarL
MREILIIGEVRFLRDGVAAAVRHAYPKARTQAAGFADGMRLATASGIDVLVVELDEDSAERLCELRTVAPKAPILGLVLTPGPGVVLGPAALGVRAFVSPSQTLDDVVGALAGASRGEAACPPEVAGILLAHLSAGLLARDEVALTARERQVAALIARGMSNKEIATTLVVEPATVKNHVHSILRKLHVHRRGEAAALLGARR